MFIMFILRYYILYYVVQRSSQGLEFLAWSGYFGAPNVK